MHRYCPLLFLGAVLPALLTAQAEPDRWYELQLAEHPVGYYHESVRVLDGGPIVTTAELKMIFNRMGTKLEFSTHSVTEESGSGNLLSQRSSLQTSGQAIQTDAVLKDGGLAVTSGAAGQTYTRTLPEPGPLCGSAGLQKLAVSGLHKVGDAVSCRTFVPELGKVAAIRRNLAGQDGGGLARVDEEIEGIPGKANLLLARDGSLVERRQAMPFGELRIRLSDRAAALSFTGGAALPEEMYDRTLARANVRLPDPRSIDSLKLRITQKRAGLGLPDLNGENQRVLEQSPSSLLLEVHRPAAPADSPVSAPASAAEFLKPNSVVQSDDPEVRRIAAEEAAGTSGFSAARKLQEWVAAHLSFDLGIALAPASEVARDRRGTCVAYAVLLAALERAAGLPSRVAIGMVYEQGIWGGHAWTEVKIGHRWIPLDAALYTPGPADAARFYAVVSSMEDGAGAITSAGLQLYGNVEIAVTEYTIHGKTVPVPPDAKPYEVTGDVYRNRWLATSVRKPAGFRFTLFDAVFPDAAVVAMESPQGQRLRLEYRTMLKSGGEPGGRFVDSPQKASLVVPDGNSVWVLTSEGADAPQWLDRVASGWTRQ